MFDFIGPFTTDPLKDAGFQCPKLSFALRNPLQIAKCAQEIVQDGAKNLDSKNLLQGVLKSPIEVSRTNTNIPDGILIKIDKSQYPCIHAVKSVLEEIPDQIFGLIFLDDSAMPKNTAHFTIIEAFSSR